MAIKASSTITLSTVVDVASVWRYYLLQSSTLSTPSKPSTNPPGGNWSLVEPSYTTGSTNSLYFTDLTVFSDGTFSYSDVSLSSSYEAAKEAYNQAVAAGSAASAAQDSIDSLSIGGRNLMIGTLYPTVENYKRPRIKGQETNTYGRGTATVAEHGIRFTVGTSVNYATLYFGASANTSTSMEGMTPGETYTFSADASWKILSSEIGMADTSTYIMRFRVRCRINNTGSFTSIKEQDITSITQAEKGTVMNGRVDITFTIPTNATAFHMGMVCSKTTANHYATGDFIELRNMKLETGTRATAWSPAPEDLELLVQEAEERNLESEDILRQSIDGYAQNVQEILFELNKTNGTIEGLVKKDDLSTYVRYGVTTSGDGTLELGQNDSEYVARVSPTNGFQVIYENTEMSSMKKNTIQAPVMKPTRMIQIGDNIIKLSSDGGLMFN